MMVREEVNKNTNLRTIVNILSGAIKYWTWVNTIEFRIFETLCSFTTSSTTNHHSSLIFLFMG